MKTLSLVEKRVSELITDSNKVIPTNSALNFHIRFPFRNRRSLNEFYWFMAHYLEPGTNLVSYLDDEINDRIPLTVTMLETMAGINKNTFSNSMTELRRNGLILTVSHPYRFNVIYMNPFFVTCGNNFNRGLFEMFRVNNRNVHIEGEHLLYPEGLFYRMNRNEDCMFGNYNNLSKRSILQNGESTSGRTSKSK